MNIGDLKEFLKTQPNDVLIYLKIGPGQAKPLTYVNRLIVKDGKPEILLLSIKKEEEVK